MDVRAAGIGAGAVFDGRYRIESALGQGGYGAVYVATQLNLGRRVALKVLHPEVMIRQNARERFEREAQLAQQLTHPNVVRLFDFGVSAQRPFIVFELLEGRSLEQEIATRGPLAPARVARIASQVLKALAEAHARGIVHRDIKPGNIFLSDFAGEPDFVKVLDFGIAAGPRSENKTGLTQEGISLGTPAYMAPEQVLDEPLDGRADLYALGLVMSEMLSGSMVFQGTGAMAIAMQQIAQVPVPHAAAVLGGPLGPVIARATQKERTWRFASALEMLERLGQSSPSGAVQSPYAATTSARTPQLGQPAVDPSVRVVVGGQISGAVASRPTEHGTPDGTPMTRASAYAPLTGSGVPLPGPARGAATPAPLHVPAPAPPVALASAIPPRPSRLPWLVALVAVLAAGGLGALWITSQSPPPKKATTAKSSAPKATTEPEELDPADEAEKMAMNMVRDSLQHSLGAMSPQACNMLEVEKTWVIQGVSLRLVIERATRQGFTCKNHAATASNAGNLMFMSGTGSVIVYYGPEGNVGLFAKKGQPSIREAGKMLLVASEDPATADRFVKAIQGN